MTNHIGILMDASGSMGPHRYAVPEVVDGLVANLAAGASQHPDQETRVSVYTFDTKVQCVFYDKDVLRLPSIKGHYSPTGMTAMIDATLRALDDMGKNPELYGGHANLLYVMTDGHETQRPYDQAVLRNKLRSLPGNYTVAALVPDDNGRIAAERYGFAPGNIAVWDAKSAAGVREAGAMISRATSSYMTAREAGVQATTGLFSTAPEVLNEENLHAVARQLLGGFQLVKAIGTPEKMKTEDFVTGLGLKYVNGDLFYQLIKREKIQGHKQLLAQNRKTKEFFYGDGIRHLVGLGTGEQSVAPDFNKEFALFVQSTAPNRHVVVNQDFVIMRPQPLNN